jgi:hypothetical protein
MTALHLADAREAADIAAFLARLLRWDKAAVVRIQAAGGVLAVFGHPPFGGVLAIRTAALATPEELDATVSAGQFLDGVDAIDAVAETVGTLVVPASVTGPAWAGLLPPRGGWQQLEELPSPGDVRAVATAAVAEFRTRAEQLPAEGRTRAALDALADVIWSRQLGTSGLPLRAVHAAHALGFLRPARVPVPAPRGQDRAPEEPLALLASGPWLRLRTPYGSVAVRRASAPGSGLGLTPVG